MFFFARILFRGKGATKNLHMGKTSNSVENIYNFTSDIKYDKS